jgi:hypothetical protein
MRPDDAETTDELDVAVVGVVGARLDALTAAVTIAAPHREADEVVSQLATLTHAGPVRWDARATWREWIVGLTADPTGAVFAVTADGALRIVGDGRRYPLPVRAGLAAVTAIGPGELLACGAGALVRIAIGPGRLAVEVTEDDGPGEALALAAGPGADGAIAVGTGGALWRCDGRDWEAFETEARESLVAAAWAGDGRPTPRAPRAGSTAGTAPPCAAAPAPSAASPGSRPGAARSTSPTAPRCRDSTATS